MSKREHEGRIGEYWLSQHRTSPYWHRTWFDRRSRQTRRVSLGTDDFEEAHLKLAEWVVRHEVLKEEAEMDVDVTSILHRYLEHQAKGAASAPAARIASRYWLDHFRGATVADLNGNAIDDFISWLRKQGHSTGYINRTLATGRAALNRAHKKREIRSVPYIQSAGETPTRQRVLSLEEVGALFDAAQSEHVFMFLMVAFNTLARPGAVLDLTRFQVDFDERTIDLNPTGRRQTKKYRPIVPITDTLLPWLRAARTDHVVSYYGRRVANIKTAFRKTRERAGLDKDVIPYTIRHTMATELRARGISLEDLAGQLGHKRPGFGTTERYASRNRRSELPRRSTPILKTSRSTPSVPWYLSGTACV